LIFIHPVLSQDTLTSILKTMQLKYMNNNFCRPFSTICLRKCLTVFRHSCQALRLLIWLFMSRISTTYAAMVMMEQLLEWRCWWWKFRHGSM